MQCPLCDMEIGEKNDWKSFRSTHFLSYFERFISDRIALIINLMRAVNKNIYIIFNIYSDEFCFWSMKFLLFFDFILWYPVKHCVDMILSKSCMIHWGQCSQNHHVDNVEIWSDCIQYRFDFAFEAQVK